MYSKLSKAKWDLNLVLLHCTQCWSDEWLSGIMWLRIYSYKCKESEPTLNFNKLGRITCIIYSLEISLVYFKRYFWLVKLHEETLNSYVVWVCCKFLFQYLVPISIHRAAIVTPTKLVWPWNVVHMTFVFFRSIKSWASITWRRLSAWATRRGAE